MLHAGNCSFLHQEGISTVTFLVVEKKTLQHCNLSIGYMAGPLLASGLHLLCESQCPCGLHCVISGLLAGGSPGFRSVLCCFDYSPSSVWRFLWLFLLVALLHPPFQSLGWYKVIITPAVSSWRCNYNLFWKVMAQVDSITWRINP